MGNKVNDRPPAGRWWAVIILSALMIFGAAVSAASIILWVLPSLFGKEGVDTTSEMAVLRLWIPSGWIALAFATYYPLAKLRQKYRDMVEYDRFGNLRKQYSTMSSAERKKIEEQKMADIQRVAPDSLIKAHTHEGPADPDAELEKMIGLGPVKNAIREMKAQMEFDKESRPKKSDIEGEDKCYHMCFSGPPGTGKTTVARILTSYLYRYGVIKKNKSIEIDGNTLKGNTPSETNMKVTRFLQAAYGGVLFIDEAYALAGGTGENTDAVATLVKYMEDFRDEFVLVLAGYENEMKALVSSNPGFKSRIQHYLSFQPYSAPELREILMGMAGQAGYAVDGEAYPLFDEIMAKESRKKDFGNARAVRNCLTASIRKHKSNYMNGDIGKDCRYKLCREDITYSEGLT